MHNRQPYFISLPAFLLSLMCGLFLSSCTQSDPNSPQKWVGKKPILFDYTSASEVKLLRTSLQTGESFQAHLVKNLQATKAGRAPVWEIVSSKDGVTPKDKLANGSFIEHVLDTTHSILILEIIPTSPLEALGLDRPRFALEWTLQDKKHYRIKFGSRVESKRASFAEIELPGQSSFLALVQGSTLEILEHILSFDSIRLTQLIPIPLDDYVFVNIFVNIQGKSPAVNIKAERQGVQWVNAKNKERKPLPKLQALLEKTQQLEIQFFEEDVAPRFPPNTLQELIKNPFIQIQIKSRGNVSSTLSLKKIGNTYLGAVSLRPETYFVLEDVPTRDLFTSWSSAMP